jgi:hypothetical protein
VQRGEHEVPGERCFDHHVGGFRVARFPHHDHVRVGAQEGAQRLGESPVDLRVDLHLAESRLGDFDRILGGPDLAVGGIDVSEGGVQGGGLAGAGGADAQHQAVGALDQ